MAFYSTLFVLILLILTSTLTFLSTENSLKPLNSTNITETTEYFNPKTNETLSHYKNSSIQKSTGISCSIDSYCYFITGFHSRCFLSRCICDLGYRYEYFNSKTCLKIQCTSNSDCLDYHVNTQCNIIQNNCLCKKNFVLTPQSQRCYYHGVPDKPGNLPEYNPPSSSEAMAAGFGKGVGLLIILCCCCCRCFCCKCSKSSKRPVQIKKISIDLDNAGVASFDDKNAQKFQQLPKQSPYNPDFLKNV